MTARFQGWALCGALAALALVGLAYGDFARQWQPVPQGLPGRTLLAYVAAVVLLAASVAAATPTTRRPGTLALTAFLGLWTLGLQAPAVVLAPAQVVAWLGLAEIASLALGAATLFAISREDARLTGAVRVAFGLCCLVFGLSHFVYASFTALLIPAWIPQPLLWAYATGAAHAAAGLALITGVKARLAATLLAAMCWSFAVLVHLPRVIAEPTSHAEWLGVCLATAIGGAAWAVRAGLWPSTAASDPTRVSDGGASTPNISQA